MLSKEQLKKRKFSCRICKTRKLLTRHHIKPKRYGGQLSGNYVWLCRNCHDKVEAENITIHALDGLWHIDSLTKRRFKVK